MWKIKGGGWVKPSSMLTLISKVAASTLFVPSWAFAGPLFSLVPDSASSSSSQDQISTMNQQLYET